MSSTGPTPETPLGPRGLRGPEGRRLVLRLRVAAGAVIVIWAGTWAVLGLALASVYWHPGFAALWIVALCGLVALVLPRPRAGGMLLILAGMVAAVRFDDLVGLLGVATPAVLLGAVHVLLGCLASSNREGGGPGPGVVG